MRRSEWRCWTTTRARPMAAAPLRLSRCRPLLPGLYMDHGSRQHLRAMRRRGATRRLHLAYLKLTYTCFPTTCCCTAAAADHGIVQACL